MKRSNVFKNVKLGKNVYRQMKRRGVQNYRPPKRENPKSPTKHRS